MKSVTSGTDRAVVDGDWGHVERTVVTGGAGFLGSNLIDRLMAAGGFVICVDNLQTGSIANIAHHLDHPRFLFLNHDVCEPLPIVGRVTRIYNLACPASPPKYQRDPVHTMRTSVLGAINALELARTTGATVLEASTSEVYGDPEVSPQREDYRGAVNTFGPRACYDEGKRAAETLFHDYAARHGVRIRVVRIFNTYGPRMAVDDGRVVSNFILQALGGEDLTIYGNGDQTRSFCYVDDLLDAMQAVMELPDDVVGPTNIGNPGEFTIRELAGLVLQKTGAASRMRFCDLPVDDPRQRRPDIGRVTALTGWQPSIPLSEGLDRTIAHFRRQLRTPEVRRLEGAQ